MFLDLLKPGVVSTLLSLISIAHLFTQCNSWNYSRTEFLIVRRSQNKYTKKTNYDLRCLKYDFGSFGTNLMVFKSSRNITRLPDLSCCSSLGI